MPANKSSPVYQHFKFPDGRDKDKFRAICIHCNTEMKGDKRSPTNLKNHMSVSTFCDIIFQTYLNDSTVDQFPTIQCLNDS